MDGLPCRNARCAGRASRVACAGSLAFLEAGAKAHVANGQSDEYGKQHEIGDVHDAHLLWRGDKVGAKTYASRSENTRAYKERIKNAASAGRRPGRGVRWARVSPPRISAARREPT